MLQKCMLRLERTLLLLLPLFTIYFPSSVHHCTLDSTMGVVDVIIASYSFSTTTIAFVLEAIRIYQETERLQIRNAAYGKSCVRRDRC